MINVRLLGGAPAIDFHFRSAPAKLPHWISAVVVLIAAAAVALGLILAGFGLFAALRIAHGYGNSIEGASAATGFAPSAWRKASGGTDHLIPTPIGTPVVARSDPAEGEVSLEPGSMRSEPPAANAGPVGSAAASDPTRPTARSTVADAPLAASGMPAPGIAAADDQSTGSVDRAALAAPANESPGASPPQTKRHSAVKRHVVRKRVRRIARRPAYSVASPFQPMFGSP